VTGGREVFVAEIADACEPFATAARLRELGVSSVLAGSESGVELADRLCAILGTPGNGWRRSHARRDTFEMTQALRAADVRCRGH